MPPPVRMASSLAGLTRIRQATRVSHGATALGLAAVLATALRSMGLEGPAFLQLAPGHALVGMVLILAAVMPQRLPPFLTRRTVALAVLITVMNVLQAASTWRQSEGEEMPVRLMRATCAGTFVLTSTSFAVHTARSRGTRFWLDLRTWLMAGNGVRLVVVLMLRTREVASHSYPPGSLSFERALLYNTGCLLLAVMVLSPPCRQWMSDWAGSSLTVLAVSLRSHMDMSVCPCVRVHAPCPMSHAHAPCPCPMSMPMSMFPWDSCDTPLHNSAILQP